MSTPVERLTNPFSEYVAMTDTSQIASKDASGASTGTNNGSSEDESKQRRREKKRVGFTGGSSSATPGESGSNTPRHGMHGSEDLLNIPTIVRDRSHLPQLSADDTEQIKLVFSGPGITVSKPRPAIRHTYTGPAAPTRESEDESGEDKDAKAYRKRRAQEAFERGKELERDERIRSEPNSRYTSPVRLAQDVDPRSAPQYDDIPLQDLESWKPAVDSDEDSLMDKSTPDNIKSVANSYAQQLVESHKPGNLQLFEDLHGPVLPSGAMTPVEDQPFFEEYKPEPTKYRGGILGALLKLRENQTQATGSETSLNVPSPGHFRSLSGDTASTSAEPTPQHSPPDSGASTPRDKRSSWYFKKKGTSSPSLTRLIGTSSSLGSPIVSGLGEQVSQRLKEQKDQQRRPGLGKRVISTSAISVLNKHMKARANEEVKIKNHISETIARQRYLIRLCKALMMYGAPTHRLEEYMKMSSRVLEMEAQFLYIPGAMIMSFNDRATHTTEVKLVRVPQGLDLGKLRDVHEIYKEVVHDRIGADEAMVQLKEVMSKKQKHSRWTLVPVFGLASVFVGPFAFGARLIDLPIAFLLGCMLGILQLFIAPSSDLYANVFEIAASVLTSFLARMFGSINGGETFCFAALAQSSIALILPGYTVLCASLELQSRSMVAGSVRMVYAIIYSLFLGFGITIGTAVYGILDHNATSSTTCSDQIPKYWSFFFVPGFTMCLIVINQAKWKQAPMMLVIALVGYIVNFFSSQRFEGNTQVSNTLSALAIGVMANAYSRIGSRIENFAIDVWEHHLRGKWKRFQRGTLRFKTKAESPKTLEDGVAGDAESTFVPKARRVGYSLAAAAMLPAIFVQVPSGLAVNGSLISGIASANQITGNATNGTQVSSITSLANVQESLNTVAFNVGYSVIQVAIGITVGLFLSAIVVYPFGKKRSGLFSF